MQYLWQAQLSDCLGLPAPPLLDQSLLPGSLVLRCAPLIQTFNVPTSKFVTITLVCPLPADLDSTLYDYLPLYCDLLFEAPVITSEGSVLNHESVATGVAAEVIII